MKRESWYTLLALVLTVSFCGYVFYDIWSIKVDCEARGLRFAKVYGAGYRCVEVKP